MYEFMYFAMDLAVRAAVIVTPGYVALCVATIMFTDH